MPRRRQGPPRRSAEAVRPEPHRSASMEAMTQAGPELDLGTGSRTLADLVPLAGERYGDTPAFRHTVGDVWVDVSFRDVAAAVREIALGLVDLGLQPGDRVAILAHTRPEWAEACFGIVSAGGVLVTIYQSNSPQECQYILEHSGARAVFVEDRGQLDKVRAVRGDCPRLEHAIVIEAQGADLGAGEIALDELRGGGRERDPAEFEARWSAVAPEDVAVSIYTSGTTGPPKGCLITHANYRFSTDAFGELGFVGKGESTYLFLPLAHGFALLMLFHTLD